MTPTGILTELPNYFTGHVNGDGVSVCNGLPYWRRIVSAEDLDVGADGKVFTINLDDLGYVYSNNFQIKFQQYGNYPWSGDGREFDDVRVYLKRMVGR